MSWDLKRSLQDGRGLYFLTTDQIKDYILTYFAKDSILLGEVDNTSDKNKPISIATQNALNNRLSKEDPYVQSINAKTGNVVITPTFIGLGAVDNTSDKNKPISIATQNALDLKTDNTSFTTFKTSVSESLLTKANLSSVGATNGIASLDANKLVPIAQVPVLPKTKIPTAQTADRLTSPVTLSLKSDITGSVTLDGSMSSLDVVTTLANTGVIAGTYGTSLTIPRITVNTKGLISTVTTESIPVSSLTTSGIVKLNNTVTSTSTTEAATASSLKVTYDLADSAYNSSLKITQRGVANGVASLDATGRVPISQLPESGLIVADRLTNNRNIKTTGDATWSVAFNGSTDVSSPITLASVFNTPGTYGAGTHIPSITIDAKGRITDTTLVKVTPDFSDVTAKPTTISGYGITDVYSKTQVDTANKTTLGLAAPTGMIMYYTARNAPAGWLACNGQAVSRTTYSELFAVIGTTFGVGDQTTTFNLPDLRGEFIRGWDDSRGIDPSRGFGSYQSDEFKSHNHLVKEGSVNPRWPTDQSEVIVSGDDFTRLVSYQSTTTATGGSETRPRNIAFLPCIKI